MSKSARSVSPVVTTAEPAPELTQRFYAELRAIAEREFASERNGHTLQPTAVVNEACVRLLSTSKLPDLPRPERLALAGRVLRQVLIDHARGRETIKRGGGRVRLVLTSEIGEEPEEIIELSVIRRALERLRELHARQADVITLRIFSGLTMDQISAILGVARRTIEDDWTVARAWLRRELLRANAEHQP